MGRLKPRHCVKGVEGSIQNENSSRTFEHVDVKQKRDPSSKGFPGDRVGRF